ncbi:MAG TPA: nucleotidyltransferase domain-containing protein [Candidatus Hydrogenedentes bacterium]|nr:nucleotidyltransferase domain-containing protein [Candidatus Hydrogenedentota bacterium]HPC15712.1 nucleotidyltransferase domain-containing protein [Candidatus Hydrogenedentota bacterium]HRT19664.1 nucleotidyltransferase domain-containing protein [Candidatus Hydrogenedentota bacterium]HRT64438.1 nucleotidyltransferase domain-containing protein [Candidatus Hydrogenedentota bacterium]
MLADAQIEAIASCAREFGAKTVWLFGSALGDAQDARDIDLAVEGVAPERFFPFYFRLILALQKPVDLSNLSPDPPLSPIIREKGVRIYQR